VRQLAKVVLIELSKYKEWTEILGNDREHLIQEFQSRWYNVAVRYFSNIKGFVLPLSYDKLIVIADGLKLDQIEEVMSRLREEIMFSIDYSIGYGSNYIEAQRDAYEKLKSGKDKMRDYPNSLVYALHFDFNKFGENDLDVYQGYYKVMKIVSTFMEKAIEEGGLITYLGGDNFVGFFSAYPKNVFDKIETLDIKVGVGVGKNARESLYLAARALHYLRQNRGQKIRVEDLGNGSV
jgi:GTP cyclohydrolase IIa